MFMFSLSFLFSVEALDVFITSLQLWGTTTTHHIPTQEPSQNAFPIHSTKQRRQQSTLTSSHPHQINPSKNLSTLSQFLLSRNLPRSLITVSNSNTFKQISRDVLSSGQRADLQYLDFSRYRPLDQKNG